MTGYSTGAEHTRPLDTVFVINFNVHDHFDYLHETLLF